MRNSVLLLLLGALQADPAREAVDRLRSDAVEERDAAARKLKELGKAAVPELEKAAKTADAETAGLARHLIRVIDIADRLSPRLRRVQPGIEERLAAGDDHAWTVAFLDLDREVFLRRLRGRDLSPLVPAAFRGAKTAEEKQKLCYRVDSHRLAVAVPDLVRLLKDKDEFVRTASLGALTRLQAMETVPQIREALKDPDDLVSGNAAAALGKLGVKEAVPDLAALLGREKYNQRELVMVSLARLGARESIPAISKLLDSGSECEGAVEALRILEAREKIPQILRLLEHHPEGFARSAAVRALNAFKDPSCVPAVVKLLAHENANVRCGALEVLRELRADSALPEIRKRLEDADDGVRQYAVGAIHQTAGKGAAKDLLPRLKDENKWVRQLSAQVLGALEAKEAAPDLIRLLKDPEPVVRKEAAKSLRSLRAREAGSALVEALNDGDVEVRFDALEAVVALRVREALPTLLRIPGIVRPEYAAAAIFKLGGYELIPDLEKRLSHERENVCEIAILALGFLGSRASLARIAPLLEGPATGVQIPAMQALAHLGAKEQGPRLLARFRNREEFFEFFYREPAEALGRLHVKEAIPDLLKALADQDPALGGVAAEALGRMGVREAIPGMLALAGSEEYYDRSAAASALGWLGGTEVVPPLLKLLKDSDGDVAAAAADALAELGVREAAPLIRELVPGLFSRDRFSRPGALCRLGFREAVPALLGDPDRCSFLNAVRHPEAYERLRTRRLGSGVEGARGVLLDRLLRDAGWTLEGPADSPLARAWRASHFWSGDDGGRLSALHVLEGCARGPYTFVVEKDRVRILPVLEALDFWAAWWAAEPKPEKK
ncbi:MAG TPA: HEAT repeat domain-containing protein [Planctomycetota bacterium]|nr:HEAT repeat domain-containing protein [Planctomycetota bacterium]